VQPLGAVPLGGGLVEFRVWAPQASSVHVRIRGEDHELRHATAAGVFEGQVGATPGDDYLFVLDGGEAWPDPCSRSQPEGVRGPSRIVDLRQLVSLTNGWSGLALDELVIYELHVGTFTGEGTFDAVIPQLPALRELGVTAVELMPVATFPGRRGWGYDGVYAFSPHPAYGGPEGLARLVRAAHASGLGVILDVVYNHVGPGSEAIAAFGPYFTERYETFWGAAMNYDGEGAEGVREWAIQNACMWVRDYGVDGLRLDAIHAIFDQSHRHVLAELAERVRKVAPRALIISETTIDDLRPIAEWGHDAQWSDDFHHALHVLLTGERDGYYQPFGRVADLARAFERKAPEPERFVVCAQNHDQVGNRAAGDRLPRELLRLACACVLFAPQTPLLFMGQEHAEPSPFQFFTDHTDPAIAEATREGRRREFAQFAGFGAADVPDPQAVQTFERSKLSRRGDPALRSLCAELIRLRQELPREVETKVDEGARILRVRRGPVELVADFDHLTAELRRSPG
jgi:maltooligosyltrehalose trehalohydrolase